MAAPTSKTTIAQKLDYTFRDESLLDLALTAAGAKEENYDGNRTLAQIGKAFVDLVSTKMGYISGTNPGMVEIVLWKCSLTVVKKQILH
jgi:dsRNA-specific ribonuclease